MFVRFRKAGDWRLKVYLAETARRDGKVVQSTVAYLGSIDTRRLGPQPDEEREEWSIHARVRFWETVNPKLKLLANRLGGEAEVKRYRMAIHARIPWPMAPERALLEAFAARNEGKRWHGLYKLAQSFIEIDEKHLAETIEASKKKQAELRQEAMRDIAQANMWEEEAKRLRNRATAS